MSTDLPTSSVPKRADQLHAVFDKAINESINSMNAAELNECCAGIDGLVGNNIRNVFVNMINNAETKMQESYDKISKLQKLDDLIRSSMNLGENGQASIDSSGLVDSSTYGGDQADSELNTLVLEEKQKEKERLAGAIQQLDGEVRRAKDSLSRLKAQVQNEIAAATEECQKMSVAAAQIGHMQ